MAQTEKVTITCPQCNQPFTNTVVRVVEAADDTLAIQLAAGTLNQQPCPNCGFVGMVSWPLLYHDRQREALLAAIPGLEAMNEEQVWAAIGPQLEWIVGGLPLAVQEAAYLYQPRMFPTVEILGMIVSGLRRGAELNVAVKAAYRSQLLQAVLLVGKDTRQRRLLFAENSDLADEEMLGVLNTMIEESLQNVGLASAARLTDIRDDLAQYIRSTVGLRRMREHVASHRPDLDAEALK